MQKLHRYAELDPDKLDRKYRRMRFWNGQPRGSLEREQDMQRDWN
jgi:hypothetical protein